MTHQTLLALNSNVDTANEERENKNVLKALKGETLMLSEHFFLDSRRRKTFIVVCLMMSCSKKKKNI